MAPVFLSGVPVDCCFRLRYSLIESFRLGADGGAGTVRLGLSRGSLLCVRVTIFGHVGKADDNGVDVVAVDAFAALAAASSVEKEGMATLNMECVGMGENDWPVKAVGLFGFSRYSESKDLPATTSGN